MKIKIFIQSLSDIITNSSSELFAVINSDNDTIDKIYQLLNRIIGPNQELELTPVVSKIERPTQEQLNNWEFRSWILDRNSNLKDFPESWIEVELPYSLDGAHTFYKYGLDAILKESFGDNFEIKYV